MQNVILHFIAIISLIAKGLIPWKSKKKKKTNNLGDWISFGVLYFMIVCIGDDCSRANWGKKIVLKWHQNHSEKVNLIL